MRLGRKLWFGLGLLIAAVALISLSSPIQLEWHKWRLRSAKTRFQASIWGELKTIDQLRMALTGKPPSGSEMLAAWKEHEDALVKVGFLKREKYENPAGSLPNRAEVASYDAALRRMEKECKWWRAERVHSNELAVTGCAGGLKEWEKQATDLGLRKK